MEPESNQPSRVSLLLGEAALGAAVGAGEVGRQDFGSLHRRYQALEPFSPKSLETASMVSSVQMGLPQSLQ